MEKDNVDVIIIGGGIIGLCSAYYLQKEGLSVTIIDKGPDERAASHANCGLVSPSHALPLNNLKTIRKSLLWMFQPDSPFLIRPQLDPRLYQWLLRFVINSRRQKVHHSMLALNQLLISSKALYQELIKEENIQCQWQNDGILFVCKKEKTFLDLQKDIRYTQEEIGLSAVPYVGELLQEKEPALKDDNYGAWLYEIDAHLKPDLLIDGLKETLLSRGVKIISDCLVTSLTNSGQVIQNVVTTKGSFSATQFVLSGGALSVQLAKVIGLRLPIIPGKGYSITMKSPGLSPKIPCIMQERKVVATPWKNGTYRLGGTMGLGGFNTTLNKTRLNALKSAAVDYLKEPFTDQVIEEWYGWRSMTPDGVPIIDRSPKHKNLTIACGHNMLGISMGTGTGKLVSEIVCEKELHIDSHFYSLSRLN
ncbi:MAG: FAD-dependent oxidoreductase [Bacteroidetes bacterium]|nr:FAD-dependent oxidoreductase [Bacteroidota bacterium]MDA1122306.1 FAD-dependent oxidoreductase [Bacteroidota bacterium]